MRNILITGGAGFIGSNFVHYCRKNDNDINITVIDALTYAGNRGNIECFEKEQGYEFVHGDICDESLLHDLIHKNDVDTIIHFAAESHVDRSIQGPDAFIQSNIVGTHVLLKCARQYWLDENNHRENHRFHHVSTDEVYGSLAFDDPAFHENTAYDPSSPYSASKAASDHLVRAYHRTYGMNVTISNCSNNYGPYHYPEKLIPLTILNILHGKPVPVYGQGANIRDWLYVTDHCRAIELILHKGETGRTYNIGGRSELNNLEVVNTICRLIDEIFRQDPLLAERYPLCPAAGGKKSDSLITFVKDRPGHDLRYAMDISKINNELGFEPLETFQSGITRTIRWYIDNESWWRKLLDGSYQDWLKVQYG